MLYFRTHLSIATLYGPTHISALNSVTIAISFIAVPCGITTIMVSMNITNVYIYIWVLIFFRCYTIKPAKQICHGLWFILFCRIVFTLWYWCYPFHCKARKIYGLGTNFYELNKSLSNCCFFLFLFYFVVVVVAIAHSFEIFFNQWTKDMILCKYSWPAKSSIRTDQITKPLFFYQKWSAKNNGSISFFLDYEY